MNILSSSAHFRQRVVKKSYKVGVTAASNYYRISRQAIYEWRAKYDGHSWKSLVDKSHRPKSHPNQHTQAEKKMSHPSLTLEQWVLREYETISLKK